jgi:anti-sigma factor RsiW
MTTHISPRDWEALSAYLDGQLAPKERQLLEARLQTRADLRAALEDLRRTREVLRSRLPIRAPRNFTLTPEMAGIRPRPRTGMALFPAMRLASALSSLMFVLVVLGDLFLGGRLGASRRLASEQQLAMPVTEAPAMEAPLPAAPEVALPASTQESAQATPQAVAKAVEPTSPTPLAELAQPIPAITDTVQMLGREQGAGGGEGETADQSALSQMAPAATATPLPTLTLTPSPTLESLAAAEEFADQTAEATEQARMRALPERALWRWVEALLALVGVSTGLIALYLHRTGRA